MQPDLETMSALRSLFDQAEFRKFRAFLEALEKDETHRAIHAVENPEVQRGRAQMIAWLRRQIEDCRTVAANMERRVYDKPPPRRTAGF